MRNIIVIAVAAVLALAALPKTEARAASNTTAAAAIGVVGGMVLSRVMQGNQHHRRAACPPGYRCIPIARPVMYSVPQQRTYGVRPYDWQTRGRVAPVAGIGSGVQGGRGELVREVRTQAVCPVPLVESTACFTAPNGNLRCPMICPRR